MRASLTLSGDLGRRCEHRSRGYRGVVASIAAAGLLPNLVACYSYVPVRVDAASPEGREVAVRISDRGRVLLERQVGSGVQRLQGRLLASTDSTLSLAITSVQYVDHPAPVRWSGEAVTIDRNVVIDVAERRLSRSRSWLAGGIAALVAAALTTLAIEGFGGSGGDNRPPGDGNPQE